MRFLKLIILFSVFVSCNKKVINKNSDYQGIWLGHENDSYFSINIDEDSYLKYERSYIGGGGDDIAGRARLGKDKLHVRMYSFEIISPPKKIDSVYIGNCNCYGHWSMKLISPNIYGGYEVTYYKTSK